METHECNALLEKLYDQMERKMQVNFSPTFFCWVLLVFPFFKKKSAVPLKQPDI